MKQLTKMQFDERPKQNQIHLPTKLVLSAACVASSWLSPVVRAAQPNQEKKIIKKKRTNES